MTRRDKHASADELASLGVGELRRRKAVRIQSHAVRCTLCTEVRRQLDGVPAILAGASYPPMPDHVATRIDAVLSVEATQQLAVMPATETGRRDLPARRHRKAAQGGWHLPGLSVLGTRLVAAAGAIVVVTAGSYELATHVGSSVSGSPSSGRAAVPAPAQEMSLGPVVSYGQPGAQHAVHAVVSSTNFVSTGLRTQVISAVHAAEARGASAAQPPGTAAGPSSTLQSNAAGSATSSSGTVTRLAGCIGLLASGRDILLVDLAKFEGRPATIIVAAATAASPAEAWVVGSSCSATSADVLAHTQLGHI